MCVAAGLDDGVVRHDVGAELPTALGGGGGRGRGRGRRAVKAVTSVVRHNVRPELSTALGERGGEGGQQEKGGRAVCDDGVVLAESS